MNDAELSENAKLRQKAIAPMVSELQKIRIVLEVIEEHLREILMLIDK